jgi:hypothetical protein
VLRRPVELALKDCSDFCGTLIDWDDVKVAFRRLGPQPFYVAAAPVDQIRHGVSCYFSGPRSLSTPSRGRD